MGAALLPRLTKLGVTNVLDAFGASGQVTSAKARAALDDAPSMLWYAASGGHRSPKLVEELGDAVREVAEQAGFPDKTSQAAHARFDRAAAALLGSHEEMQTGEALRDDVWSWITTIVVPDVVAWRFPERAVHRFAGGVRNALQRLWARGVVLDLGEESGERWKLVNALSEDAAVQIFERASIAGNRDLAVSLAQAWLRVAARQGREQMEPVMRRATKLVRLRNEIIDLAGLSDERRDAVVDACFRIALMAPAPDQRPNG